MSCIPSVVMMNSNTDIRAPEEQLEYSFYAF